MNPHPYGTPGWWDCAPDDLAALPPAQVAPLSSAEVDLLRAGFYPASLWVRAEPPARLPAGEPWIGGGTVRRGEHYGYEP